MSKSMLMIFPSSTHPVRNGAQVRINHLIHHFRVDLGWEVDFFCPQGLLRPPSWGQNIDYLRNVFIPRPIARKPKERPALLSFGNLYKAMEDGMIVGFMRDLKQMRANLAERSKPVPEAKSFEILAMRSPAPKPKPQAPSKEMRGVHSPMSARLESYNARHYADSLKELIEKNNYDAVMTTYAWMSKPLDWLFPREKRPFMILDTIDIQYQRESRLKPLRAECAFEYEKEKNLELEYMNKYDMLLGITELDSEEMRRQLKDKPVCTIAVEAVIPETCRVDESTYDDLAKDKVYDLSFIGANNEANRFSVLHLLKEIVPPLVKRLPDVKIALAGEVCADPEVVQAADAPNVLLLNYVDSLEEFFKKSKALIAPIVAGGGVKLKILEALAHGVPVLTSPIGAEGIAIENGVHGYITADDRKFVDKAVSLLNSPDTLKRMALSAQRLVEKQHSAQAVYKEIDEALEKHLGGQRAWK